MAGKDQVHRLVSQLPIVHALPRPLVAGFEQHREQVVLPLTASLPLVYGPVDDITKIGERPTITQVRRGWHPMRKRNERGHPPVEVPSVYPVRPVPVMVL